MKKQASRLERAQSELLASCESCPEGFRQSEIPEYYAVLNEHDLVIKENEDLRSFVKYLTDKISSLHNVLSTVAAHAEKSTNHIVEGEFRFPELVQYLEDRKLGKEIWLSDDGTRIKVQVQYDTRTNQLVGLVPQLDRNGLPKVSSFVADSAENIKQQLLSKSVSNYEYVLMAQPMADFAPFLLCMFGTDNKFSTMQILQRWKMASARVKKA
ncbi:Bifunctional aspartokinase/homoserine dehydrogenase 2, chloroplastic [Frankliniella fusca]|uniref:Bifunctional aspartokinase/homoserine dehydrogenase 2, chloroplastic n=1 Tax=Frankliniella fusca TaxID=407009 RepID=A0AAE1HAT2_9NEOP|nr:Bifunctional aspartokinase/homoserine dehydrogenase 2, chloroplastic [Frankliniella fusca]